MLEAATELLQAELRQWWHVYRAAAERAATAKAGNTGGGQRFDLHPAFSGSPGGRNTGGGYGPGLSAAFGAVAGDRGGGGRTGGGLRGGGGGSTGGGAGDGGTYAAGGVPAGGLPPLALPEGLPAAEAADFATGCVHLNRMHCAIEMLGFDEKRALIYGGDMIVP